MWGWICEVGAWRGSGVSACHLGGRRSEVSWISRRVLWGMFAGVWHVSECACVWSCARSAALQCFVAAAAPAEAAVGNSWWVWCACRAWLGGAPPSKPSDTPVVCELGPPAATQSPEASRAKGFAAAHGPGFRSTSAVGRVGGQGFGMRVGAVVQQQLKANYSCCPPCVQLTAALPPQESQWLFWVVSPPAAFFGAVAVSDADAEG